jgi:Flp pilus assembly protein TadG
MLLARTPNTKRRPGTTLSEAAIVLPLCMLFCFGIYEYGRFVMIKNLMDDAAREGARQAVTHVGTWTTDQVQTWVTNIMGNQTGNLSGLTITVYMSDNNGNNIGAWNSAAFGQYIAVQVNGTYKPVLPSFLYMSAGMPLQSRSVMYSEGS